MKGKRHGGRADEDNFLGNVAKKTAYYLVKTTRIQHYVPNSKLDYKSDQMLR